MLWYLEENRILQITSVFLMALQMFLGFVFFNLDVVVVFDVFCNAMVEKTQRLRVVKLKRVGLCEEGCNIGTKK